jgi:uncharacterized protein YgiM (DUF1202 family)
MPTVAPVRRWQRGRRLDQETAAMNQPARRTRGRYAGITQLVVVLAGIAGLGVVLWAALGGATPAPAAPTPTAGPTASAAPAAFPTPAVEAVVNNDSLNLRAGPGQDYAVLGVFTQGTALVVLGQDPSGDWLEVQVPDGRTGWMARAYLTVNVDLTAIGVVAGPPTPIRANFAGGDVLPSPTPTITPTPTVTPHVTPSRTPTPARRPAAPTRTPGR